MEKTLKKALKQIESCFNHLNKTENYGIIVIHTHLPFLNSYLDHFIKKSESKKIILLSIIDYEILINNPREKIFQYLEQNLDKKLNNKREVNLFFTKKESCNSFLMNSFKNTMNVYKKKYHLDKI